MPPAKPIVLPAIQVSLPPHINPVWTRPTIIKPDKEIKGLRRSELRGEDSIKACCWRKVIAGRSLNQIAIDLKSSDDGHVMRHR